MDTSRFLSYQHDEFDALTFLQRYNWVNAPGRVKHMLRCYHDAFQDLPNDLKVLDYGSGPVMLNTISAAKKASEIVLSDYMDINCKFLRQWLDGDSAAFDWSPHFRFVVQQLEGKGEREVKERQEQVRKLVKAVVHCDLTQDPPIESGYDKLYDVVLCTLVMEGAARSHEEYVSNALRLGRLVKPGGLLLMYGIENRLGYYTVADHKYRNLHVTAEFAMITLKDAGFCDLTVDKLLPSDEENVFMFIKGLRKH